MQDRQFLEKRLDELKLRKVFIKNKLAIDMAQGQVLMDEIQMQIDDIQKHFDSCVERN